jgi:hypothetical protein
MAIDLQALKTEFQTNPVGMPYLAFVDGNDTANADIINNADGSNPRTVNNQNVDTGLIRGNVTFDAFDGLVVAEQSWFEWLTANGVIPVNAETLQQLAGIPTATGSIWAAADRTAMNAAMTALMQRNVSRAEEIVDTIGSGTITGSVVRDARLS